jgi:PKD repeat protein
MSLTAAPEILPRDGSSTSTITAKAFDANGKPLAGQRLSLAASTGTLNATEVVTGSDGSASFIYIAPGMNENVSSAAIYVTPVQGSNITNANARIVQIELNGPPVPAPSFTFTPATPVQNELVTFDATATTVAGAQCGSACSYTWDFGDGGTDSGLIARHRFSAQKAYFVTLTVSSSFGTSRSTTRTVNVGALKVPTAVFIFSPTNPKTGDTVFFDATESTAFNGATIKEYRWDFGDGSLLDTNTPKTSHVYGAARAFKVRLTVVDSNDLTAFVDQTITVATP